MTLNRQFSLLTKRGDQLRSALHEFEPRVSLLGRLRREPSRALQHHAGRLVAEQDKLKYFEGTPIPTSLMLLGGVNK